MANVIDFYGPYLKTERAKQHINELEDIFGRYGRANKKAMLTNRYRDARKSERPVGTKLPRHTPTIIGDALHNLRAALDHAYCILVEANGGTVNKHTKFPFTEKGTRQDLEGSAKGHAKTAGGPSDQMIAVIFDEVEPYPGGNGQDLIRLHVLDIADKHMVLLPTAQRMDVVDLQTTGGSISGISLMMQGGAPVVFGEGVSLEPKHNPKVSFEVCFGGGQPYEWEPVLPVLWSLKGRVDETLQLLEQRAKIIP